MDPGTWTDHGLVFRSTIGDLYNAIDPNLVIADDGTPLLSFGMSSFKAASPSVNSV